MKVKLIRSGGFAGIKQSVEEDLSAYPKALQQHVKQLFTKDPEHKETANRPASASRDDFQYHIEYNGKLLSLHDVESDPELKKLLATLKKKLT